MPITRRSSHGKVDHRAAVLCAVAESPALTCAELTEITGCSAMTVKRVTDELIDRKLLMREKRPTAADGRWGHRFSLHPRMVRLVLDLTSPTMAGHIFFGSAAPISVEHSFNPAMTFEENLRLTVNRVFLGRSHTAQGNEHLTVAMLPPQDGKGASPLYLEAYRKAMVTRGERLWEDLAEAIHIMGGICPALPVQITGITEATLTGITHHAATCKATVAVCLTDTPDAHASLFVRQDTADEWFIPFGSECIPIAVLQAAKTSPLIVPQVVLTHGIKVPTGLAAEVPDMVQLAVPLRISGAGYALLKEAIITER